MEQQDKKKKKKEDWFLLVSIILEIALIDRRRYMVIRINRISPFIRPRMSPDIIDSHEYPVDRKRCIDTMRDFSSSVTFR